MSSTSDRGWLGKPLFWLSTAYILVTGLLFGLGWWLEHQTAEVIGGILLGGTFLPVPLDVYVLHLSRTFGPLEIALIAGALNTVAVLFERWFLLGIMAEGRAHNLQEKVQESRWSEWFMAFPFTALVVGAFSFLPFELFRFMAVVNDYDVGRYSLATFLGRGVRYYALVALGGFLAELGWLSIVILVVLALWVVSLGDPRTWFDWLDTEEPDSD